jgi:hypothetical protein
MVKNPRWSVSIPHVEYSFLWSCISHMETTFIISAHQFYERRKSLFEQFHYAVWRTGLGLRRA